MLGTGGGAVRPRPGPVACMLACIKNLKSMLPFALDKATACATACYALRVRHKLLQSSAVCSLLRNACTQILLYVDLNPYVLPESPDQPQQPLSTAQHGQVLQSAGSAWTHYEQQKLAGQPPQPVTDWVPWLRLPLSQHTAKSVDAPSAANRLGVLTGSEALQEKEQQILPRSVPPQGKDQPVEQPVIGEPQMVPQPQDQQHADGSAAAAVAAALAAAAAVPPELDAGSSGGDSRLKHSVAPVPAASQASTGVAAATTDAVRKRPLSDAARSAAAAGVRPTATAGAGPVSCSCSLFLWHQRQQEQEQLLLPAMVQVPASGCALVPTWRLQARPPAAACRQQ